MSKVAQGPLIESFTAAQAARLAGLSLDMVNYLCRHEIVISSGSSRHGRGVARKYLYDDVVLLRVMAQLLAQGMSVLRLRKGLAAFRKRCGNGKIASSRYFLTDGYNVYLQDEGNLEDIASGQRVFAFVLELQAIRNAVDKKIGRVRSAVNG